MVGARGRAAPRLRPRIPAHACLLDIGGGPTRRSLPLRERGPARARCARRSGLHARRGGGRRRCRDRRGGRSPRDPRRPVPRRVRRHDRGGPRNRGASGAWSSPARRPSRAASRPSPSAPSPGVWKRSRSAGWTRSPPGCSGDATGRRSRNRSSPRATGRGAARPRSELLTTARFHDRLVAFGGPILVINGGLDVIFRMGERAFLKDVPRVTTRVLPLASHLTPLDDPKAFSRAVADFVEALPA